MELYPPPSDRTLPNFFNFTVTSAPVIRRQFSRLMTRQLDQVKVIVSLVEGAMAESQLDFERIVVFSDLDEDDRMRCERVLAGYPQIEWLPLHFTSFLQACGSINNATLIVVCGETKPYAESAWQSALHNSLSLYPQMQQASDLLTEMQMRKPPTGASLVFEESFGRYRSMEFDAKFVKGWQKHLQSLNQESFNVEKKVELLTGWGFAAVSVKPTSEHDDVDVTIGIEQLSVDPNLSLQVFCDEVADFIQRSSARGKLRQKPVDLCLITPIWTLSHFMHYQLRQKYQDQLSLRKIEMPDTISGWHPIISLIGKMGAASDAARQCLFIESFYKPVLISCI